MPYDQNGNFNVDINQQDTTAGGNGLYQLPNGSWSPTGTYYGLMPKQGGGALLQGGVDPNAGLGGAALGPGLYSSLQDVGGLPAGAATYDLSQHGGANLAPGTGWVRGADGNLTFNQDVVNQEAARQYQQPTWSPTQTYGLNANGQGYATSKEAAQGPPPPAPVAPSNQANSMATAQAAGAGGAPQGAKTSPSETAAATPSSSGGGYSGDIGGQHFTNGQLQGQSAPADNSQAAPGSASAEAATQRQSPDRMGTRFGRYGASDASGNYGQWRSQQGGNAYGQGQQGPYGGWAQPQSFGGSSSQQYGGNYGQQPQGGGYNYGGSQGNYMQGYQPGNYGSDGGNSQYLNQAAQQRTQAQQKPALTKQEPEGETSTTKSST